MKRFLIFFGTTLLFNACSNNTGSANEQSGASESTEAAEVTMALPTRYSGWSIGDMADAKMVIDMYKAWEENRLEDVAKAFGDSTVFDSPQGHRSVTTSATLMDSLKVWRGYSKATSSDVIAVVPLKSKKPEESWVCVWSLNKWTDQNDKTDSSFSNDNWQIKNGKIVFLTSLEQKPVAE